MNESSRVFPHPARLKDVAEAAGVSTATVSRTLTFPDRVSDGVRARVLAAANRLGYAPNEAARTLRAGASRMVLVLRPDRASELFFSEVFAGVDTALAADGYAMVMGSIEGDDAKARRLSDLVFARHFDGVLIVTGVVPVFNGRSIFGAGIPIVSLCAEAAGEGTPVATVLVDDKRHGHEQTRHLIGLGHRRLMYLAGLPQSSNERWRYRGFLAAVAEAGLSPDDVLRQPGDFSLASGAAAARSFLDIAPRHRPTGVVCASDEMAIGFMKVIRHAGLICPADVSVIGFDDIEFASYCEPALTTMRQPRRELGMTGARALLAALRGQGAIEPRVILPATLVVRDSTAPPPTPKAARRAALADPRR